MVAIGLACAGNAQLAAPDPARLDTPVGETVRTSSGLEFTRLRKGFGEAPSARSTVRVHYHGTFPNGRVFDSSVERGSPSTFALNRVIRCWTEGIQYMREGGKSRLVCPFPIAYGDRGRPPTIPPRATLIFEVELLEIL